jgi:DNA-directed RNA polymerase subunit alpha
MEVGIVETLTAPSLNFKDLYSIKINVAHDEEAKKVLETFNTDYDSAKNVIPQDEQSLRKGIIESLMSNHDDVIQHVEKDNSKLGRYFYTESLYTLNRSNEAKDEVKAMVEKLDTNDTNINLHIAILACNLRLVDEAKKVAESLDFDSLGLQGVYLQSYIDELEGNYIEAIEGYERATSEEHDLQGMALFQLANLQDLRGFEDIALESYKKIEELGYIYEEALVNMGVILEDKFEFSQALSYYEKALNVNPKNSRAKLYYTDAEASLNMLYDETKRKQDLRNNEILNIPISDFELSVRSRNCLSKMGIFTLKDLITKTEQELLGYKNFGETSLKEIRAMLAKKGLHLGMTRIEEQPLAERIKMNAQLYSQEKEYSLDELDISIENLDLSYRTKSALHKLGFESLRDITMRTGTDLEANDNFSAACLQEVNALLAEKGLGYRPATSSGKVEESAPEADADGNALLGGSDDDSVLDYDD